MGNGTMPSTKAQAAKLARLEKELGALQVDMVGAAGQRMESSQRSPVGVDGGERDRYANSKPYWPSGYGFLDNP